MENIAYVQFDSVETAKKYKEMDLEINSVPISSKFVPDRMSAERKRTKGTKWEKKKAAKREAAIAEKKAQNGDDSKAPAGNNFTVLRIVHPPQHFHEINFFVEPKPPKYLETGRFFHIYI